MSKSILMLVTSHNQISAGKATGIWFEEFAVPYDAFHANGYSVTVASPLGGPAPIDPNSADQVAAHPQAAAALQSTRPMTDIQPADYDAVVLPGGHGTMFDLPTAEVGRVVSAFAMQGRVIAAVCHGPAGLVEAVYPDGTPVVKGKRMTSFTDAEERAANLDSVMPFLLESRLRGLGADFIPAPLWSDHVEVDGLLITGQNPASSGSLAQAVIRVLSGAVQPA